MLTEEIWLKDQTDLFPYKPPKIVRTLNSM